ncbi:MAG: glycosyltransferase family 4 protein [Pirellulales bacterium]|nr:glycosyltransferase family 4 protein [Pirellulales bacterium]
MKCADAIVCISDFTKQQLYLLFKDGITNKKVCRIYLGGKDISLDRERAHPILQEGESFLLFVGVGGKNKNLPFLVACFDRLRREYAYLGKLYIVGQSGQDKDLIRAIGDLRLEQHVRQLGFVDDAELPSLYRACDAFVFPSYYEGFGLPALEASRYGARVCASDAASLGEIAPLCNAHCANPFDEYEFTQAMHETVNSARPPELEAECFNWENAAHQLLEICNALFVSKHVRSRGGTS